MNFDQTLEAYHQTVKSLANFTHPPERDNSHSAKTARKKFATLGKEKTDLEARLKSFPRAYRHAFDCACNTCTSIRQRPTDEARSVYGIRVPLSLKAALKKIGPDRVQAKLEELVAEDEF